MKTSPNGAPILSGSGLQSVRERIQQRFDEARKVGATSLMPAKPRVDRNLSEATPLAPKPLRPLHEIVAPVVRVAERKFAQTAVRHPLHEMYHVISEVNNPNLNQLFREALAAIEHIAPPETDLRHEVEDVWGDCK